ncbi:hypothetical protein AGLY_008695 [Aphis glycines]|uniref:Uncharacterized protein n=1 Tax=Aphis glycines TaxID=307491 RepID=A0A6G0TM32_APHGL|nr:hypothetical protein AGLY_008695 [Aphis glycines]
MAAGRFMMSETSKYRTLLRLLKFCPLSRGVRYLVVSIFRKCEECGNAFRIQCRINREEPKNAISTSVFTYDKVRREAKIFPTPCLNSSTRATQNHKKIYNLLKYNSILISPKNHKLIDFAYSCGIEILYQLQIHIIHDIALKKSGQVGNHSAVKQMVPEHLSMVTYFTTKPYIIRQGRCVVLNKIEK